MVKSCCVYKCRNRKIGRVEDQGIHFFRFPVNSRKRAAWKRALNRKDWSPGNHSYVCSAHFHSGWHFDDPRYKDYAPSKFPCVPESLPENLHDSSHHRRNLGMAFDMAANLQIDMENKKLAQSLEFHKGYICKFYHKLQKPAPETRTPSCGNDSVKEKVHAEMVEYQTLQSKDSKQMIVKMKMFSKNRVKMKTFSKNKSVGARSVQAIPKSAPDRSTQAPAVDLSQDDINMKNTTNSGTMTDQDHLLVENEKLKKENALLKEKLQKTRRSSRCSWCYTRQ